MKINIKAYITIFIMFLVWLVFINRTVEADVIVDDRLATYIMERLNEKDGMKNYVFPENIQSGDVIIKSNITWDSDKGLILCTNGNIIFENKSKITIKKEGLLVLKAGMEPGQENDDSGTVLFESESPQIHIVKNGKAKIYYNPKKERKEHKYHNSRSFAKHFSCANYDSSVKDYMLINNIRDLQEVIFFLRGNYALSQNIDASITKTWNAGKGFRPLKYVNDERTIPFSGDFDGNGYTIKNLFINRPDEEQVGLFGRSRGWPQEHNVIENVILSDFDITGDHYVGGLVGGAIDSNIYNIGVSNLTLKGRDVVGGIIGSGFRINTKLYFANLNINIEAGENKGSAIGGVGEGKIDIFYMLPMVVPFDVHKNKTLEIIETKEKKGLVGNKDGKTEIKDYVCYEINMEGG